MGKDAPRSARSPELPPVRSEHSGAFVRLSRLWQHRNHFSLVFAAVDNPAYRDALIARLAAVGGAFRVGLRDEDTAEAWLSGAQRAQAVGATRLHLCLPLDRPRSEAWWQQANLLRERLADALPGSQVLWLSDTDADIAARQAPDLWNWREAVLSFLASAASSVVPVPGPRFDVAAGAEAALVAERVAAIEQYLAAGDGDDLVSAHLRLEAAQAYASLGQWDLGIEHARRAAATYAVHGNENGAAAAKLSMAQVLRWRGQLDQALHMLKHEVLPVLQRLGSLHPQAVAMGQIADILRARGQLDEALRIRQEQQLPVFERLGDVRSKAVTLSRIADILLFRGRLAEARQRAADAREEFVHLKAQAGIAHCDDLIRRIEAAGRHDGDRPDGPLTPTLSR
jgi:tetratricopeptide (TPR) repeat protein